MYGFRFKVVKTHPDTDVMVHLGVFTVRARDAHEAQKIIKSAWDTFHADPSASGWDLDFPEYSQNMQGKGITVDPPDDTPILELR